MPRRPRGAYLGGHTVITPGKPRPQPKGLLHDQPVVGAPLKGEHEADIARLARIKSSGSRDARTPPRGITRKQWRRQINERDTGRPSGEK